VVIYTVDPRGVLFQGFTAADQSSATRGDAIAAELSERSQDFFNTQEGLNFLARETGGLFVHNTNDISAGLGRILDDQSGYYLIAYGALFLAIILLLPEGIVPTLSRYWRKRRAAHVAIPSAPALDETNDRENLVPTEQVGTKNGVAS